MDREKILSELKFKAVRSSGAGGQNVNKVSSKVVLAFDLTNSSAFSTADKDWLLDKWSSKLTSDGILILNCDEDRSQLKNKSIVTERLFAMLGQALVRPKIRKATKIPKSAVEKRLNEKKFLSTIKDSRKKPDAE